MSSSVRDWLDVHAMDTSASVSQRRTGRFYPASAMLHTSWFGKLTLGVDSTAPPRCA